MYVYISSCLSFSNRRCAIAQYIYLPVSHHQILWMYHAQSVCFLKDFEESSCPLMGLEAIQKEYRNKRAQWEKNPIEVGGKPKPRPALPQPITSFPFCGSYFWYKTRNEKQFTETAFFKEYMASTTLVLFKSGTNGKCLDNKTLVTAKMLNSLSLHK